MNENLVFVAKSTIKVQFPEGQDKPGYSEMLKFAFELGLEATEIYSIYQEYTDRNRAMFIKVKNEALVQEIVGRTFEMTFKFESGVAVKVQLSEANGNLKYVRIFNLIPEVEDEHIEKVLEEYGTIKKQVREKFPAALGVDIYTGVRGVFMEIQKPLPPYMPIGNLRAKLFYHGMTEGCFYCGGTDHVRKDCPKRITPFSRAQQQDQRQQFREQEQQQDQQQQPRQIQQTISTIPPRVFPTIAEIIQQNIASSEKAKTNENLMFAPNSFLPPQNNQITPPEPITSNASNENKKTDDWNDTMSSESGEDEVVNDDMEIDLKLAEPRTSEKRITRSNAANGSAAARSRSNSMKKTQKPGNKVKKIKTDVLERIAKANDKQ